VGSVVPVNRQSWRRPAVPHACCCTSARAPKPGLPRANKLATAHRGGPRASEIYELPLGLPSDRNGGKTRPAALGRSRPYYFRILSTSRVALRWTKHVAPALARRAEFEVLSTTCVALRSSFSVLRTSYRQPFRDLSICRALDLLVRASRCESQQSARVRRYWRSSACCFSAASGITASVSSCVAASTTRAATPAAKASRQVAAHTHHRSPGRSRFVDRLVGLIRPVRRYRCESLSCAWKGNLFVSTLANAIGERDDKGNDIESAMHGRVQVRSGSA
jgi:hypothetical protein